MSKRVFAMAGVQSTKLSSCPMTSKTASRRNIKPGVILVDLTAAYDTVWHQGLTLKLLRIIPDRHMVKFICNILANRRFVLKTSDGQSSRPRQLRNGVPQGSVLSPLLFNIYISDIPLTTSRQYGYADDLALLHSDRAWSNVENTLTADMSLIANISGPGDLSLACQDNRNSLPPEYQGG